MNKDGDKDKGQDDENERQRACPVPTVPSQVGKEQWSRRICHELAGAGVNDACSLHVSEKALFCPAGLVPWVDSYGGYRVGRGLISGGM